MRIEPGDGVPGKDREKHQAAHVLVLIFLLLAAGIITAGYSYYRHFAKNYRTKVEQQLNSVAELKVGDLTRWRDERVGDADIFYKNSAFYALVRRAFENPQDVEAQGQLRSWLGPMWEQNRHQYDRVFLLDTRGLARISVPDDPEPVASILTQRAAETLRSGQVTIVDFYRNEYDQRIHLAVLVPVLGGSDGSGAIGVLVLRMNPQRYLYPFLSRWPTPSRTAETLLIRRDGNNALFLNELRFQTNTALNLRVPLQNGEMPAVKAALGQEGIVEGTDYRGIPVLADVRAVPGSPWFLEARMDTAEIYAPVRERLWGVAVVIGILLIGAGAGVAFVWRGQSTRFYRERAEASEMLRETNEYLENLFNYANAPIIVWDPQFRITRFNHAFESLTGRRAQDVIGKSLEILFPPDLMESPMNLIGKTPGRERWETVEISILHLDGSVRTALWNSATIFAPDRKTPLATITQGHDITERKRAEQALREAEEQFHSLFISTPLPTFLWDLETLQYLEVNDAAVSHSGYSRDELLKMKVMDLLPPEAAAGIVAQMQALQNQSGDRGQGRHRLKDGRVVDVEVDAHALHFRGRRAVLGVIQDITERKRAEENLLASERRWRSYVENAPYGIFIADEKGKYLEVNPEACSITGYDESDSWP